MTFQKSVAQLNHLSSKNEITSAFDPLKDGDFGRRIEKYARKSFSNLNDNQFNKSIKDGVGRSSNEDLFKDHPYNKSNEFAAS